MSDNINGKSLLLLNSLLEYYKRNINIFTCILVHKHTISLRILDWLVTNYAKKHNIIYIVNNIHFNIYLDYKNQLKAYSKKLFDPFCRRERIQLNTNTFEWAMSNNNICESDNIITTVGQLNFFKWFMENNILNYAIENITIIDQDMTDTLKNSKKINKRKELSQNSTKAINSYNNKSIIYFN